MSISVNFYNNLSDNRDMIKSLSLVKENVNCDVYDPCDVINPTLIVDLTNINVADINYCEIPGYKRKYFITSVEPESAYRVKLNCHVDVLSTYNEKIRKCPLIAERSSNQPNYYLNDNMRLFNTYTYNQYIDIGTPVGKPDTVILITFSYDT